MSELEFATESRKELNGLLLSGKYLTFELDGEEYGLEILKVREIMGVMDITHVPQTLPFVLGVINLRGKVIPVLDLRLKFGLEYRQPDERTCTIVVEVVSPTTGARLLMGIVVDQVREVVGVRAEDIDHTPSFGFNLDTDYILGMAKIDGKVKILLDIDRIFGEGHLVAA